MASLNIQGILKWGRGGLNCKSHCSYRYTWYMYHTCIYTGSYLMSHANLGQAVHYQYNSFMMDM